MALTVREKQVRWLQKMKEQHRCNVCGRQDERTLKGMVKCAICAERDKASYRRRKELHPEVFQKKNAEQQLWRKQLRENHLCVDCSKQDAFTLGGRPKCAACAEKDAKRHKIWRIDNPEKYKESLAAIRSRYISQHRCTVCGRALPFDYMYRTCQWCREHKRQQKDERTWRQNPDRIKRGTPGMCYFCVKRPVMEGKKICRKCYEERLPIMLANVKKAQEKNANHIWRKFDNAIKNH